MYLGFKKDFFCVYWYKLILYICMCIICNIQMYSRSEIIHTVYYSVMMHKVFSVLFLIYVKKKRVKNFNISHLSAFR